MVSTNPLLMTLNTCIDIVKYADQMTSVHGMHEHVMGIVKHKHKHEQMEKKHTYLI